ncbi:MAG TPA: phosphinothricin acetyltransferase [Lentisphaeria bacterium]|nr:MAG: phosphinothricin acetyltransferase [Lentisphaerae bacterium GWF2_50_93]HCE45566.1 phosphinothricin acetyltransferase [Lentisphaeria bacterium]
MIRKARTSDAEKICSIYNYYIENTVITFEEVPLSARGMAKRIKDTGKDFPWIVYVEGGQVLGYAYTTKWKTRSAYRHTLESTVYLHHDAVGKGIGTKLYKTLLPMLKKKGYHAVVGCLAIPNKGSTALHEKFGFKKVAHFKEVGLKFGKWIDVGYWELVF